MIVFVNMIDKVTSCHPYEGSHPVVPVLNLSLEHPAATSLLTKLVVFVGA